MMAFFVGLLKIIGIVLLVLFVVLLVIISCVLLVPLKYHAEGSFAESEKGAKADVTWLCRLVKFRISYLFPGKPLISLKILGIELLKENNKKKKVKIPKELKKIKKINKITSKKQKKKRTTKEEKYHPSINAALLEAAEAENKEKEAKWDEKVFSESKEKKESNYNHITEEEYVKKPENKIEKIIFKIRELYDKIMDIIDNINYYMDIWEQEDTQSLLKEAWSALRKILISIKPKAYKLDCLFGFETPDTTGRAYGYYCMLLPWLDDNIYVEPDFEQKTIIANGYIKGKITLLTIAINALRILFDKRLMPLINKIKNGGK